MIVPSKSTTTVRSAIPGKDRTTGGAEPASLVLGMAPTGAGAILLSVPEDPAARRRVALATGIGIGWLAFYGGWLAVRPGGERALWVFSDTAYVLPLAAAAAFSLYAWIRVPRELRPFWALLTCGNLAWRAGRSLWRPGSSGSRMRSSR